MYVKQSRDPERRKDERREDRNLDERPGLTRVRLLKPPRREMTSTPTPAKRKGDPPGNTGQASRAA